MARSIRIEYPGAFYHVMARGNRREHIYRDEVDRRFFLQVMSEACEMTGWRVHAWVLMSNHYHLFLETPEANLVVGMQWLQNTYTRRFNARHQLWGRLFGDRYKAIVTDGRAGEYYLLRPAGSTPCLPFGGLRALSLSKRLPTPPRGDAVGTVCGAEPSNCTDGTFTRVDARFTGAPSVKS